VEDLHLTQSGRRRVRQPTRSADYPLYLTTSSYYDRGEPLAGWGTCTTLVAASRLIFTCTMSSRIRRNLLRIHFIAVSTVRITRTIVLRTPHILHVVRTLASIECLRLNGSPYAINLHCIKQVVHPSRSVIISNDYNLTLVWKPLVEDYCCVNAVGQPIAINV